jgi:hypothetical protein
MALKKSLNSSHFSPASPSNVLRFGQVGILHSQGRGVAQLFGLLDHELGGVVRALGAREGRGRARIGVVGELA